MTWGCGGGGRGCVEFVGTPSHRHYNETGVRIHVTLSASCPLRLLWQDGLGGRRWGYGLSLYSLYVTTV